MASSCFGIRAYWEIKLSSELLLQRGQTKSMSAGGSLLEQDRDVDAACNRAMDRDGDGYMGGESDGDIDGDSDSDGDGDDDGDSGR